MATLLFILLTILGTDTAKAETGTPTDCHKVIQSLSEKTALYKQLGDAFLQSNQALEDVYSQFSKRLMQATPQETNRIADHFQKSAESLKASRAANELALKSLETETEALKNEIAWCSGEPRPVRLFAHAVKILSAKDNSVQLLAQGQIPACATFRSWEMTSTSAFKHEIQFTSNLRNCGFHNTMLPWQRVIDLTNLPVGRHEFKFNTEDHGFFFNITAEVKP